MISGVSPPEILVNRLKDVASLNKNKDRIVGGLNLNVIDLLCFLYSGRYLYVKMEQPANIVSPLDNLFSKDKIMSELPLYSGL